MTESVHKLKVAVLASGTGSNFAALAKAANRGELGPAEIRLLLCNRKAAPVLERAHEAGVPSALVEHRNYSDRATFDAAVVDVLREHDIELVMMAGFMRIVTSVLLRPYEGRIINVHPSLLPAFPGADAIGEALSYSAKVTGVTVHFVEEAVDAGSIIMQEAVTLLPGDDRDALANRVHAVEHRLLPAAVRMIAEQRVSIKGRHVSIKPVPDEPKETKV